MKLRFVLAITKARRIAYLARLVQPLRSSHSTRRTVLRHQLLLRSHSLGRESLTLAQGGRVLLV